MDRNIKAFRIEKGYVLCDFDRLLIYQAEESTIDLQTTVKLTSGVICAVDEEDIGVDKLTAPVLTQGLLIETSLSQQVGTDFGIVYFKPFDVTILASTTSGMVIDSLYQSLLQISL